MLVGKRKNKNITRVFFILISFTILLLQSCSSVKVISDKTFSKIANYKIGDNRTELTKFSHIIDSLSSTKKNLTIAEENILTFLKTDATLASKQFVCRELRIIGTVNSIPVLTEMLGKEETTDIARYALEKIQEIEVDEALIEVLPKATKKVQLGIINTLGVRKSGTSVSSISKLLTDSDNDIAIAAASALGKIANKECIKHLTPFLGNKNNSLRNTILDSYLLCADKLVRDNNIKEANKVYSKLYEMNIPINIKQATLVGLLNTSVNKEKEILNRISNGTNKLKFIPISKIRELSNNTDLKNFANLLPALEPENQIQLLSVFEDRRNKSVKPFVLGLLESKDTEVKIAAIRTLANVGNEADIIRLATIAANETGDIARYARASLGLLQGDKIDKTILLNLPKAKNNIKVELIKAIGARNLKSAHNDIIKYTKSEDSKIRSASFRTLTQISTEDNLPSLVSILFDKNSNTNRKKAERTISKVLAKYPENQNADLLLNKLNSTSDVKIKSSLLRLLGFTSRVKVLKVLRNELNNENDEIKIAAVSGLSNWQSSEPLTDLIQVINTSRNKKVTSLALKGSVKFISMDKDLEPFAKVKLYKNILPFAKTSNEQNLVLDGVGHTDCFESLEVIKPYINRADVKQTVDDCINRVSWHLHQKDPERVKKYVNWFLSKVKDEKFQEKNTYLINVIDRYIKNKNANLK